MFSRTTRTNSANASARAADALHDVSSSELAAESPAAARHPHHAHHPAPPEVPEAAESELEDELDDEEEYVEFDPLLFIKTLPPLEQCIPKYRPVLLPRQTRQCKLKTLVLDLDETLVHSSLEHSASPDFSFDVRFNNQARCLMGRMLALHGRVPLLTLPMMACFGYHLFLGGCGKGFGGEL